MKTALTVALGVGLAIALVRCNGAGANDSPSTSPDDVAHDDPTAVGGTTGADDIATDSGVESYDASVTGDSWDSGVTEDAGAVTDECAAVTQQANISYRPVDIVFIVDNSSSMEEEIAAVQDRINADFARIIGESGVDYRVIMFSRYGSLVPGSFGSDQHFICVRGPLGASDCTDPDNTPLQHNPPRFYHYSTFVASHDSLCLLLKGWDRADETVGSENLEGWAAIAPHGYSEFLRPEAIKHFVVITDDQVDCEIDDDDEDAPWAGARFNDHDNVAGGQAVAEQFDEYLLELSPEQFGTAEERNYKWHSIVGMSANTPATEPWPPTEPIQTGRCGAQGDTVAAGTGYQALSELTGGLRYPICEHQSFDAVFQALAETVVTGSRLACEWELPEPETGEPLDPTQVNVQYTGGGMATSAIIGKVAGPEACTENGGWYYDDEENPTRILTCPATCAVLEADPEGSVDIALGCATVVF